MHVSQLSLDEINKELEKIDPLRILIVNGKSYREDWNMGEAYIVERWEDLTYYKEKREADK